MINLDEALTVRFTEPHDGRGEGLAGVDLIVGDRHEVLRRADARGVPRPGADSVVVGGVRFRLS